MAYPLSEAIQLTAMNVLSTMGDLACIKEADDREKDVKVRELLAIAGAGAKATTSDGQHAEFVKETIRLVGKGSTDFIRSTAARTLGTAIPLQPGLRAEGIAALKLALKDPASRGTRYPREPDFLVRRDAACALGTIGVPIRRNADGTWTVVDSKP